ncbi:MAG: HAMP domain-containing histidine kinase [Lachnospiraceae bacterium]|nr:HAMP domain-containing histidine kinase [Lachnospiraceae bacterium]
MRIKTKVISLVAGVLFGSCAFCGTFAVNQYMNASIRKLADVEMEKLELAERAFSQVGTKEDLDAMDEAAREAYLRYQFERCYQEGYALLKGRECIKNMTKYEITAPEALGEKYVVQPLGIAYLLILKKELPFLKDFWVLSVQDITSTWEEGKEQAKWYLVVFLFVFACSITIAAAVIGHMLKALVELRDQAERIKNGDFNKKVVLTSKDELKDLSDSLNRMSDQLQQQIEDLEFLLGSMAHEMKTPLTSIIGYADSLLHVRLSDHQKEQSLAAICRSAGRLDEMSGKLLQLIGFYGNEKIVKKPVELVDVMMWIYEENRETLIDKGIDFKIVLENTVGVQKKIEFEQKEVRGMAVQGDPMLLVSLFSNLVSNSIKALEGSGKIQIILIPEKHKVCVQDNGVGIPSKDLPHVTKAFYMVDKSRSRRQQGSGLGLALVQRISKVHGAKIEIESRLKEGTKVWICFPSSD